MTEKRKYSRDPFLARLEIKNGRDRYPCASMNLSEGGLGILCDRLIELGTCTVYIDDVALGGRIIYRLKQDHGYYVSDKPIYLYGMQLMHRLSEEKKKLLIQKSQQNIASISR